MQLALTLLTLLIVSPPAESSAPPAIVGSEAPAAETDLPLHYRAEPEEWEVRVTSGDATVGRVAVGCSISALVVHRGELVVACFEGQVKRYELGDGHARDPQLLVSQELNARVTGLRKTADGVVAVSRDGDSVQLHRLATTASQAPRRRASASDLAEVLEAEDELKRAFGMKVGGGVMIGVGSPMVAVGGLGMIGSGTDPVFYTIFGTSLALTGGGVVLLVLGRKRRARANRVLFRHGVRLSPNFGATAHRTRTFGVNMRF